MHLCIHITEQVNFYAIEVFDPCRHRGLNRHHAVPGLESHGIGNPKQQVDVCLCMQVPFASRTIYFLTLFSLA